MLKRALMTLALSLIIWGCGTSTQYETETQVVNPDAPVIIDYYAAEVIRPGTTWRVYLHAKDTNGDMRDIVVRLLQTGAASAGTSTTRIEGKHSGEVAGYLALRTPRDTNLRRDRFTLRVLVRDREGNRSETIEVPLGFDNVPPAEIPEKWEEIADRRLGFIMITIESTFDRLRRGGRRRYGFHHITSFAHFFLLCSGGFLLLFTRRSAGNKTVRAAVCT
jgi:hypothetical protein